MTQPELRLVRYFVAVAEAGNVTRAAERLHISQPSLSAAVKQLEGQLGVELVTRRGRRIEITPAGRLLARRGRHLLEAADALVTEVRAEAVTTAGRVRLGVTPTARYGLTPRLLAACATQAPATMVYTSEATTGALLDAVAEGSLDLAVTFCATRAPEGVELLPLPAAPAIVHLLAEHRFAACKSIGLEDLVDETILVAASRDSGGYTDTILAAFARAGLPPPRTRPDPYPDLGLQAVREGFGIVIYARGAFPEHVAGSAFVPLEPRLDLPFHLAVPRERSAATRTVMAVAGALPPIASAP